MNIFAIGVVHVGFLCELCATVEKPMCSKGKLNFKVILSSYIYLYQLESDLVYFQFPFLQKKYLISAMASLPAAKRQKQNHTSCSPFPLTKSEKVEFLLLNKNTFSIRSKCLRTFRSEAHGLSWHLKVYPYGYKNSIDQFSVFLSCEDVDSDEKIPQVTASFNIELGSSISNESTVLYKNGHNCWGWHGFPKLSQILASCLEANGDLVIKVSIQICEDVWYPKTLAKDFLGEQLLGSSQYSDVTFIVGDNQTKFAANKLVLANRAPFLLHELAEEDQANDGIEISHVTESTFKTLMEYIYANKVPNTADIAENATALLIGADQFDLTHLKLYLESKIISSILCPENAAGWLIVADGHTCPLLKEACMRLYKYYSSEVRTSSDWQKVYESNKLLDALLTFAIDSEKHHTDESRNDYENMTMGTLRKKLESLELDLDGSRSMLIKRLQDHAATIADEDAQPQD